MAEFFDWNPERGTWYEWEDLPGGGFAIHTKQNIEPLLEYAKRQRNYGLNDLGGERDKNDLKHYAVIPAHVELELRNKGINIYDKNNTQRVMQEIERNYPLCKVTNRKIL